VLLCSPSMIGAMTCGCLFVVLVGTSMLFTYIIRRGKIVQKHRSCTHANTFQFLARACGLRFYHRYGHV
jgi:hypothetical protein